MEYAEFSQVSLSVSDGCPAAPAALRSSVVRFPSLFLINASDYHSKSSIMRHIICDVLSTLHVIDWVRDHQFDPLFNNLSMKYDFNYLFNSVQDMLFWPSRYCCVPSQNYSHRLESTDELKD